MDEMAIELKKIFLDANNQLLEKDRQLFDFNASERTICGALMNKIYDQLTKTQFSNYYVDVEYNRNKNKIKTCFIKDNTKKYKKINIVCDLIIHSRGQNVVQDNLFAIEMKKSYRPLKEKNNDRKRLIALTRDTYDGSWRFDGITLPEHICRYKLGIYYEINFRKKEICLEYYFKGNKKSEQIINY